MPLYAYQVLNKAGNLSTGKLEAENELTAAARLRRIGYTTVDISEVKKSAFQTAFKFRQKVGIGELSLFSRQLASMLNSGIPLTRCLYALGEQASNQTLGNAVVEVARNVESGMSFSESLSAYPEIFSPIYIDMVKSGEVGGAMEEVLVRLANQLNSEKTLKDNIRTAMFYPAVVIAFAVIVLLAMLFFIVPVFMQFFPAGMALPLPTRIIISVSNILRGYWYLCLLTAILGFFGLRYYIGSEAGRVLWDNIKFRLPVFGDLIKKTTIARFSRTLSTLLAGGIPVLQAMETAGPASGSTQVAGAVAEAGRRIQEGQSIAVPLRQSKLFPAMVTLMIAVGEETGDLPDLLARVSEFYESEVAAMTKGLTSIIEPLMIIFVGCIVGVMVVSLYLPIFSIVTLVR
jgi:type IV pilus assembly protein PilC